MQPLVIPCCTLVLAALRRAAPCCTTLRCVQSCFAVQFSALRYLHDEARVVHRDVKPANIILLHTGTCQV